MTFEIGNKVETTSGLYMNGKWREAGLKGKVIGTPEGAPDGNVTVKFKALDEARFIHPSYLKLREKKARVERPFEVGDSVVFTKDVVVGITVEATEGIWAEVVNVIPDSNLVEVEFDDYTTLTVAEEVLASEEETFGEEESDPEFDVESVTSAPDNPEVAVALKLVLDRIEEIKALLTQGPRNEVVFNIHPSNGLTEEEVTAALKGEEPAPEPVFKKAKEVVAGDLLYTEGGAYDKVDRVETKDSGYTSLFGAFGNKIVQVPSGRVVQVLEEVS